MLLAFHGVQGPVLASMIWRLMVRVWGFVATLSDQSVFPRFTGV